MSTYVGQLTFTGLYLVRTKIVLCGGSWL